MDVWRVLGAILAVFVIKTIGRMIYNIWFHPLAHVPGPRLAAVTHWYHTYWHAVKKGHFVPYILPDLHKRYGPVVRFSPDEVDIHDLDAYNAVFTHNSLFNKDRIFFDSFGVPRSVGMLKDNSEWRTRRNMLAPMFSKMAINELTHNAVYPLIQKLCGLLDAGFCARARPVPLDSAMYCVTVDIITTYISGKPWNMLDEPGLDSERLELIRWFTSGTPVVVCFPWIRRIAQFLNKCFPGVVLGGFTQMRLAAQRNARNAIQEDWRAGPCQKPKHVLEGLLNPDTTKGHTRLGFDDLVDDIMLLTSGGGDTSANMIQFAFYKLCKLPDVRARVRDELNTLKRDPITNRFDFTAVEALQYLTGFMKEILRHYHGATGRQPRIVPKHGLTVPSTAIFLPAGTRVSCSILEYHMDPRLFDNPKEFRPERWMGESGKKLNRWLLAFGRGDRICLGIHLAYREMYLVIAELLDRYEMELFDTTDRDMELVDHFAGAPRGRMKVMLRHRDGRSLVHPD